MNTNLAKQSEQALHLFVVDDDDTQEILVEYALQKAGIACQLTYFSSAEAALQALDQQTPDLLFLDINMPGLNGWQVLERLRDNQNPPPVYMLSSSVFERDKERAQKYPAVRGFIVKPLEEEQLRRACSISLAR